MGTPAERGGIGIVGRRWQKIRERASKVCAKERGVSGGQELLEAVKGSEK